MGTSSADRMRALRARRAREAAESARLRLVDGGGEAGSVADALEESLKSMRDPCPALVASARRLAAALDTCVVPAVAAEFRRTLAQLRAAQRPVVPVKGPGRPNKV